MTDQWNELNLRMERAFQNQRRAAEARSLRDHFAAAALTGILADGEWPLEAYDSAAEEAYAHADAMLRRRSNQPERPDSSPVTEPMPKEKRAEVSDKTEPVAWAVMDGHEFMEFCTDKEEAKCAAGFYGDCPIVPLYRQPQPTPTDEERASDGSAGCPYVTGTVTRYCTLTPLSLTSEEREAVNYFAEWGVWPAARLHAAALRGLLERLGGAR